MENRKPFSELNLHPNLKNQVTHVSQSHQACGATHASNLLELAAEKLVKESFVFPITGSSSSRMGVTSSAGNKKHEEQYNVFNLYPNPNQGKFTLTYNYENKEQKELTIINLTGAIVYTAVLANENSDVVIDVKNLPEGFYFVVIKTTKGEKLYQTKIAIIK